MKSTKRRKVEIRRRKLASYDRWFRRKVQESIDDPRPSIPHEEVMVLLEGALRNWTGR